MPIRDDLLNPRRHRSPLVPLAVLAALGAMGAGAFLLGRSTAQRATLPQATAAAVAVPEPAPVAPGPPTSAPVLVAEATTGTHRVSATVKGTLDESLAAVVGPQVGSPLTLVTSRLLVWWMDIARDVRPGDSIELVYELPEGAEPVVDALRYTSGKLGRDLFAYRFQAPGSSFARYYGKDGKEVEERLVNAPLENYEEVTSLLRDGRHHKGVDFKAPVGTPVHMPWAGTVVRRNWNFHANGNCLEVAGPSGRHALFLHLSAIEADVRPGSHVKEGQVVARTGNTGHTTAPHLHYQLMAGEKVLDPFAVQKTYRAALAAEALAAFGPERLRLDGLLTGP